MHSIKKTGPSNSPQNAQEIYWEKQEIYKLCGLHCLNCTLQGPFYNEVDLSEIAHELDKKEKKLMEELGTETEDFLKYMAEDSFNVSEDGNFSLHVLEEALRRKGLELKRIDLKKVAKGEKDLSDEIALVCNSGAHWFCIRKINEAWIDLNSTHNFPEIMDEQRKAEFINMCIEFNYTLFSVKGGFPKNQELKNKSHNENQFWFKESDIYELNGKPYKDAQAPPHFDTGAQLPYNSGGGATGPAAMHASAQHAAAKKFDVKREENAENIMLNFRLPTAELVTYVFPRSWCLEDLYEFIDYATKGAYRGSFQIITNYPDFTVLPPTKIGIYQTGFVTGQTLFVRLGK